MFNSMLRAGALVGLLLVPFTSGAQSALFNFDNPDQSGKGSPYSYTVTGVTADFSSNQDLTSHRFLVQPDSLFAFTNMSGNIMASSVPAGEPKATLTIGFSGISAHSLTLSFATPTASTINMSAFLSGTSAGSTSATENGLNQGTLIFNSATGFDHIVLSAGTSNDFAVDNIKVSATAPGVPAPAALPLMSAGLLGLARLRRRRNV